MKILIGLHPPSSPREIQGLVFREPHSKVRQVGARQGRQKALPASRERKESDSTRPELPDRKQEGEGRGQ